MSSTGKNGVPIIPVDREPLLIADAYREDRIFVNFTKKGWGVDDVPVAGQKFTFGVVKSAQARGDFQVLIDRGRKALRVHLTKDVEGGLKV